MHERPGDASVVPADPSLGAMRDGSMPPLPAGTAWDDPDLSLLQPQHGSVPAFPVQALPPFWGDWCGHVAAGAGVPVDYVAMTLLTAAAGLIGGKRRVSPAPAWTEPCVLWTALVGPPSSGKTPAMEAALGPVHALHDELAAGNEAHQRRHLKARETARAERRWWHHELLGAVANRKPAPDMPVAAQEPQPFMPRQLVVEDPAVASATAALRGSPHGILLARDELAGWLAACRAQPVWWLKAWSGGRQVMDGDGGADRAAGCSAVSVLGTIAPDVLAKALAGSEDGGVPARLLFVVPERPPLQPLSDASVALQPLVVAALARLRDLPAPPRVVPLSAEARATFEDLRHSIGNSDGLDGALAAWWGKGAGTVLRLAGVLSFLQWAARPADQPEPLAVSDGALRAANDLWAGYLWGHAEAVLAITGESEQRRCARKALRWIRVQRLEEVGREDIRRRARAARNAQDADDVIDTLVDSGWLSPLDATQAKTGRKRLRWVVNPRLRRLAI